MVGQKFKPLCSKLVSDWVSSIVDKLTILLLRVSSFVRELLRLACIRFSLFVVRFRSKVSMPICSIRVFDSVFNFCIRFLKTDLGLKNIEPEVLSPTFLLLAIPRLSVALVVPGTLGSSGFSVTLLSLWRSVIPQFFVSLLASSLYFALWFSWSQ